MTGDIAEAVANALAGQADNFGRLVANELEDILVVDGEKDFTPERLRYFKDGTRRFLQYGTDSNFSEVQSGHLIEPDAGQTLTLQTAERAYYPVGNDLWPSMARRITQAPQSGDAVGGGYGVIDLANFDPTNITYSGTTADGFFWYHTADTGLERVALALVQAGSVEFDTTVGLTKAADILTIIEQRLNYYDVGPSVYRETYTDVANNPLNPQQNEPIGAVANDDGKGPATGSHRVTVAVSQAPGNSGLGVEMGSVGVRTPGSSEPNYKTKSHEIVLSNGNTTDGTYQVCGAIRGENDRPTVKLRIPEINITATPGSGTNDVEVIVVAVDPANTDADDKTLSTPTEHSESNSVVEQVADNTIVGPDAGDGGTGITGAVAANTMTNPGGYQLARDVVDSEGSGSKQSVQQASQSGNREIYDTDIGLFFVESATAGDVVVQVGTDQNS